MHLMSETVIIDSEEESVPPRLIHKRPFVDSVVIKSDSEDEPVKVARNVRVNHKRAPVEVMVSASKSMPLAKTVHSKLKQKAPSLSAASAVTSGPPAKKLYRDHNRNAPVEAAPAAVRSVPPATKLRTKKKQETKKKQSAVALIAPPAAKTKQQRRREKRLRQKARRKLEATQERSALLAAPITAPAPPPQSKRKASASPTLFAPIGNEFGLGITTPEDAYNLLEFKSHIVLVDLDNWTGFFMDLPQAPPASVFVWAFLGARSKFIIPVNTITASMRRNNSVYVQRCGGTKDAADFALCVHAGSLHHRLRRDIPFIVFSGDHGFQELSRQLSALGRTVHMVDPHADDRQLAFAKLLSVWDR